jgi:hypothetical protein
MQTSSLEILENTQLPPTQARAILQAMELEINAREAVFATKSDLKDAIHSLDLRLEALRGELKGLEGRLMRWTFTCVLGQTAVMAGALYFALTHLRQ